MRFAFLGSPEFAATVLEILIKAEMPPRVVICNPDRPVGRKKIVTPPPVKQLIANSKLPIQILQPENAAELSALGHSLFAEIDFAVIVAYSKIIKREILDLPKLGFIGVHPSLLPKYRGATPIQSALLNGEKETGVTLYFVDEFVDHGPIITQEKCSVSDNETYLSLEKKLTDIGGKLLVEVLPELARGYVKAEAQDETKATFTKKFRTEDGFIDLQKDDPKLIYRKIKALNPEPGVYIFKNGKRVKLLEAELANGTIRITRIQVEGERPKSAAF